MSATKEEMKTSRGAAATAGKAPDGSAGETLLNIKLEFCLCSQHKTDLPRFTFFFFFFLLLPPLFSPRVVEYIHTGLAGWLAAPEAGALKIESL